MSESVILFDTTLRDGEQALSASLSQIEKLHIAKALECLSVDYIEAGFPVSSPEDFNSVSAIALEIKNSRVAALARAVKDDIDACAGALASASQFRIHTFIATSPIHLQYKLKISFDKMLVQAVDAVRYARQFTDDVEFSCEDASRTPIDNLCRVVEQVIAAGATTINLPDTVGYSVPDEFSQIITSILNKVPNIDKAVLSVHCHNDLGLAVANSLSAINAGARQVEATINGIGERAGNCSLEELAMIIKTRYHNTLNTQINSEKIYQVSQLVSEVCQMPVQSNKAIVGANAFNHSSGIHQDGVIKNKSNYEIMSPETIGKDSNDLTMTSRSGRHVIRHRLNQLGYNSSQFNLDATYQKFLHLADKQGQVFDYDLEALVFSECVTQEAHYTLDYLHVNTGTGVVSTATVRVKDINNTSFEAAAIGHGPVEATYNALERIFSESVSIRDFRLQACESGRDAKGQVDIKVGWNDRSFFGCGVSEDILVASAQAYVNAINAIEMNKRVQQAGGSKRNLMEQKTNSQSAGSQSI